MDLATIEQNVGELDVTQGFDLIFDLLAAFGMPKASITRLRKGSANRADRDDEVLWKGKVYYRDLSGDPAAPDPHVVIDDAAGDDRIAKQQPRFLIVRTASQLLAVDTKTSDSLDIPLEKLALNAAFFMPWAGVEKTQLEAAHYADIKAAEKMAQLYDEIRKVNDVESDEEIHALNVFFTRLLFCFFAEDTGIFEDGQVTKAIGSLTHQDGSDLHHFLGKMFETLDTPVSERGDLPSYLAAFGYVNGSLFAQRTGIPVFSAKARAIILECAELDWSEISPDIFGSMMQAVVHAGVRSETGMHYTSVDNIMRVLRPLFLDSLRRDLDQAGTGLVRLRGVLDRIARIRIFDPACGSGNFLVVAYRELRLLEMQALERMREAQAEAVGHGLFDVTRVELGAFFGVDVDDFACEVARLSLWIAKHQMNARHADRFGAFPPLIPLSEAGNVVHGNAARLAWEDVCSAAPDHETYVCGNPPYRGGSWQTTEQKKELADFAANEGLSRNLDYVSIWLLKAADMVASGGAVAAGMVATSSVCQGNHVGLLMPALLGRNVEIGFAHRPFLWSNSARANAGVSCIVIGLRPAGTRAKCTLIDADGWREVPHITPYLTDGEGNTVVMLEREGLFELPSMRRGSQPTDGGHLILDGPAAESLLASAPEAAKFIHPFQGAEEFMSGTPRYCIWVEPGEMAPAYAIPALASRFDLVRSYREASRKAATRRQATNAHRFDMPAYDRTPSIVIPEVTSSRRDYIPIGFSGPEVVNSNKMRVIADGPLWLFGLLQSRMHMAWVRVVAGRMKNDFSYSIGNVYNTFPVPNVPDHARSTITEKSLAVIEAREQYPGASLIELYDPDHMPDSLRIAHRELDSTVDEVYREGGFKDDSERFTALLGMYEQRIAMRRASDA